MWEDVQRVPDVQTDDTVRAFSGTLRRISGGVCVSCFDSDPLTAAGAAVEAILVDVRVLVCNDALWLAIPPAENPRTPFWLLDARRQATTATLCVVNIIFAIGILYIIVCDCLAIRELEIKPCAYVEETDNLQ